MNDLTTTTPLLEARSLEESSPLELLAAYETIRAELRRREIVRTNDAPAGQFAEWIARACLGGELAPNSEKAYDLLNPALGRIQVKCRVLRHGRVGERQLSPFRSTEGYDVALVILFEPTYSVRSATLLTPAQVAAQGRFSKHVNGQVLIATDAVLNTGVDVTNEFVPLNTTAVPRRESWEREWMSFALTYNGYGRHEFEGCAQIANEAVAQYKSVGELPRSLDALRTCLFFEQRRLRFSDDGGEFSPYLAALLGEIERVAGGVVRDDRPFSL